MNSQKRKQSDCLDRISYLPESIISRILSVLPTKDVLRTSVLAKSWEFKWTCIYNVDILDNLYNGDMVNSDHNIDHSSTRKNFIRFVDRVVLHTHNVNSFRLRCHYNYDDTSPVTAWMSALLSQNIQNLELTMTMPFVQTNVDLARRLLDCASLRTLRLHLRCNFRVPVQSFFPNLTALDLHMVRFLNQNSRTDTLLFTFPVLESFKQEYCIWSNVKFVEIRAPKLTSFESENSGKHCDGYSIKIVGARIKLFATYGTVLENFVLIGTTILSVTLAHAAHHNSYMDLQHLGIQIRKLLRQVPDLNHLKLSGSALEAISLTKQGLHLPRCYQLRKLEVCSPFKAEALLELLHAAAVLRHLVLDIPLAENYEYNAIESVPSCIASHMEELKLCSFSGMESQYHLARFFMRNGAMLEGIYVCSAAADNDDAMAPIIEKLSQFPKASPCLKIVHLKSIEASP